MAPMVRARPRRRHACTAVRIGYHAPMTPTTIAPLRSAMPRDRTAPRLAAVVLIALLAAVTACSSGGGGGGAPTGSDQSTGGESSKLASGAKTELGKALLAIEPCAPQTGQVDAVLNARAHQQLVGSDSEAEDPGIKAKLQRPMKSIYRAYLRGEVKLANENAMHGLALWSGIDTSTPGWMDDEKCEKNWEAWVQVLSLSAVPGVAGKLQMNAHIPLQVSESGAVTGSAQLNITGQMTAPPPCTVTFQPATSTMTVTGQKKDKTFELKISYATFTLQGKSICDLPIGRIETPAPVPMEAMKDFAMTVGAYGGAVATDERAGLEVLMLTRK